MLEAHWDEGKGRAALCWKRWTICRTDDNESLMDGLPAGNCPPSLLSFDPVSRVPQMLYPILAMVAGCATTLPLEPLRMTEQYCVP